MKSLLILPCVILFVFTWRLGERLSNETVSVVVGMFFAFVAGVPVLLFISLSNSRSRDQAHERELNYQRMVAEQLNRPRYNVNFYGSSPVQRLPSYSGHPNSGQRMIEASSSRYFYDRSDGGDRLLEDDEVEGSFVVEE